jgi:hypothetical protein
LSLGGWVLRQRNRKSKINKDQLLRLNNIGFEWSPLVAKWEMKFAMLLEFKNKFGHCNVSKTMEGYHELASWVNNQRNRRDTLSEYRLAKLEKIGFGWKVGD